jgi:hypothetical protein
MIFDNDKYLIFRHFMGKYLNYFDFRFWFWKGMQFTPPPFFDMGLFYVIDILLIIPGIYFVLTSKEKKIRSLSIFWFFAGPIPASFTMNEQHPLRSLVWLPVFGMAVGYAFEFFFNKLSKKLIGVYAILLFINFVFFLDVYFRQFPRFFSEYWMYGYKEISQFVCLNQENYDQIFITDTFGSIVPNNTGIPAEYILFYCRIDPLGHITSNYAFEKIKIRRMVFGKDSFPENSLVIGNYWDLPPDIIDESKIIKKIDYPSGKPAFIFVET